MQAFKTGDLVVMKADGKNPAMGEVVRVWGVRAEVRWEDGWTGCYLQSLLAFAV